MRLRYKDHTVKHDILATGKYSNLLALWQIHSHHMRRLAQSCRIIRLGVKVATPNTHMTVLEIHFCSSIYKSIYSIILLYIVVVINYLRRKQLPILIELSEAGR